MSVSTISARIRARAALIGVVCVTLTMVAGCDKAGPLGHAWGQSAGRSVPALRDEVLDSARSPRILFEVLGDRLQPRMAPVALIDGHVLRSIQLSPGDWLRFDRRYNSRGAQYSLYQDGHRVGTATVTHGMWDDVHQPLYSLPNCRRLMPLAAVSIDRGTPEGITTEFLASNVPLTTAPPGEALPEPVAVNVARRIAVQVGKTHTSRCPDWTRSTSMPLRSPPVRPVIPH